MTDRESFQFNGNSKKDRKESILRNILKVKDELNEMQEEIVITDRTDGGSSCETVILDDDYNAKNQENVPDCQRENFSDDSLEGSNLEILERKKLNNMAYQKSNLSGSATSTSLKASGEKTFKRPSMIPKLSRVNRNRDNGKMNVTERTVPKELHRSNTVIEPKKLQNGKLNGKSNVSQMPNSNSNSQTDVLPIKLTSLQQKLKATTSLIKQKIEFCNTKEPNSIRNKLKLQSTSSSAILGVESPCNNSLVTLYKNIAQIRETASALSKSDSFKNQKGHIEKLFKNISEIQNIADKLTEIEKKNVDYFNTESPKEFDPKIQKPKSRIHVKFFPKIFKKKIKCNSKTENTDKHVNENQNSKSEKFIKNADIFKAVRKKTLFEDLKFTQDLNAHNLFTNEQFKIDNNREIENLKEIDSMDGIFIPSCEPPRNIDDDDESSGLDDEGKGVGITITFPKLKKLLYKPVSNAAESHLSLRLSDISAEAIKSLKRCPKDFTLRMDFIQGRVLLQSAKTVNVSLGQDLKFAETTVDEKKSDIISIKPSTECSFTSQLISVDSYKSLRATDSEIFNAVNLPLVFKNKSRNIIAIKSCAAFNDNDLWSMALLRKQNVVSMPEIAGINNVFEDAIMENITGGEAFQLRNQKRRKNRGKQTKTIMLNGMH